jgi:hypothetical protein
MPILNTGHTYANGNQVTSTNLNAMVNGATFASGAVDPDTMVIDSLNGWIGVKDEGIGDDQLDSSLTIEFAGGSASTPSVTVAGDTNTGVFFPSADTIALSCGGSEKVRINSDSQIVTVAGTVSLPAITTTGDLNTGIYYPAADTIAFTEGGAESMRIDSSGNLLIGTTTVASGAKLTVSGSISASGSIQGSVTALSAQTASSNTAFTFTGIPSWAKKITMVIRGLSGSSTGGFRVQLGDSSAFDTSTSYTSVVVDEDVAGSVVNSINNGFGLVVTTVALSTYHGVVKIYNLSGNIWVYESSLAKPDTVSSSAVSMFTGTGSRELASTLAQIRLIIDGTQTFDGGTVNVLYEG